VHNRRKDGSYALTHSLYYYYDDDDLRAVRVGLLTLLEQPPIRHQEAPIALPSSS
jgi:hypothetical protein